MSINLTVDEYCSECPDFEAKVRKIDFNDSRCQTSVTCKYDMHCAMLFNHLRKYYEENKEV